MISIIKVQEKIRQYSNKKKKNPQNQLFLLNKNKNEKQ